MAEKTFEFDGIHVADSPRPPRPPTEEELRVSYQNNRMALQRIAKALRLPGGLSLATGVPEAVERLIAQRSKRFLVLRGLPYYPAAFDDWVGAYSTLEEAIQAAEAWPPRKEALWYEIFDLEAERVVYKAERDPGWVRHKLGATP